jgi:tripartite-type tricarboxylate transporter receptor subunit TctC
MLSIGTLGFGAGAACGQNYPNKPVRVLAGSAGGGGDFTARLLAQGLSAALGQPFIVDNRPSLLVGDIGSKAPPDGYTLTVQGGSLWIGPLLQKNPWDVVRDFAPISLITREVFVLAVHPSVTANSVKELIALAKAKPGALNYGAGAPGSPGHLGMELFKSMAGVNVVRIAYKGTSPAVTGLISGDTQIVVADAALVMPHGKSGKLKTLAATSAQPSTLAPGLPTVAASGLPGYEWEGASGIWAPAKTPGAVITRLNQEIVRMLNTAEAKERFLSVQAEVVGSTPEQFAARIKSDIAKWSKVINDAGLRID